nr:MAG TPA: NICKEL AND COBALT RESISTANCE PROTEIN BINDING PROTEIN, SENSOR PROTEIN [Caudoviricetes sp.]DAI54786.1 MAG TPA: NICKEL AND COBALT RESISTANCE PROTEIN BINDING PROTEIN, SENSOR PROTEIN [Caudoviricetes sp.]DAN05971.1 MAG TPA: NICKEL AND COBALT RESISTANCE PROTEIN BINDING PROTEIN, SENSOR PROTEIN [Caudoviricetes sp.]
MRNRVAFWILCSALSITCGAFGCFLAHWLFR